MPAVATRKNGTDAAIASRSQSIMGEARPVAEPAALPDVTVHQGVPIPRNVREPTAVWHSIIEKLQKPGDFVLVCNSEEFPTIATDEKSLRALHDRANRNGKAVVTRRKVKVDGKVGMGVWLKAFRPRKK